MTLQEFLLANPVDKLKKDVVIELERGEERMDAVFTICAVSEKQLNEFKRIKGDDFSMDETMVINCVLEPNFKSGENIRKAGCATAEQYLRKTLKRGEYRVLAEEIIRFSGFGAGVKDLKQQAKNS